jgi:hypothetical protein
MNAGKSLLLLLQAALLLSAAADDDIQIEILSPAHAAVVTGGVVRRPLSFCSPTRPAAP